MPLLALSIGSNIDAASNIRLALKHLRDEFGNSACSTVYESESIGFDGDNFLNLVVLIETDESLNRIVLFLKRVEDLSGRDRSQTKFSPRTLDIDILIFGEHSGDDCDIELPRSEITQHAFVLQPLAEMLPQQMHPCTEKPYAQLWNEFDKSTQRLWPIEFDWQGVS